MEQNPNHLPPPTCRNTQTNKTAKKKHTGERLMDREGLQEEGRGKVWNWELGHRSHWVNPMDLWAAATLHLSGLG